jgi:hypothetical protein
MTPGLHAEPFWTMGKPRPWPVSDVRAWVRKVADNEADNLALENYERKELKDLARPDSGCPTSTVMWAILGWGKMRERNARLFLGGVTRAVEICEEIRRSNVDRLDAFDLFAKSLNEIPGITAAYFTKLIYFLGPGHDGYIMDQWTSKSVNLIFDRPIVLLDTGFVSKRNTRANYAAYCQCIEWLARQYPEQSPYQPVDGEWIERALFSSGGKGEEVGAWRQYVRDNWSAGLARA